MPVDATVAWDTTPGVSEPLITVAELEIWTQNAPGSLVGDPFAQAIIGGVSLLVREAGSLDWTVDTVPDRARLIAILVAKNYFLNPTELKSEGTGPLSESRDIVQHMELAEDQKAILAQLAGEPDPTAQGKGLWVQPTAPAYRSVYAEDVFVTDQSGTDWMIPWARIGDHLYPAE